MKLLKGVIFWVSWKGICFVGGRLCDFCVMDFLFIKLGCVFNLWGVLIGKKKKKENVMFSMCCIVCMFFLSRKWFCINRSIKIIDFYVKFDKLIYVNENVFFVKECYV